MVTRAESLGVVVFRVSHLLVEFEPRDVAFTVCVLQAEEPDLPQTHRLHHLKQHTCNLFSDCQTTNAS